MSPLDDLYGNALAYHRLPVPGKLAISATKPLATQHDLEGAPAAAQAGQALGSATARQDPHRHLGLAILVEVREQLEGRPEEVFVAIEDAIEASLGVARKMLAAIDEAAPDFVATDCPLSALRIEEGLGRRAQHPVVLLRHAYGIPAQ